MLFGRLSDRLGRRPVLLAGLMTGCGGLALFAAAGSTAWLFGARALQGLAVGMVSGPATAALVEFDPRRDEQRPALLAGLVQAGGSMLGPLIAGVLAEWGPAPYRLSFLLLLGVTIVAAALSFTLPESTRSDEPWRIQLPRVPRELRRSFARASLTAALAWASVALYLSIVPSYAGKLLSTHDLALLGSIAALALASSCAGQLVSKRLRPRARSAQAAGLAAIALGLVALALASPAHSLALLLAGAVSTGADHGVAFVNAQDELNAIAPDERRGEVTAAFICCIYAVVAGAVISTGLLDLGLSLAAAVGAVVVALATAAVAIAAWQA